jgi:hypothetical protein
MPSSSAIDVDAEGHRQLDQRVDARSAGTGLKQTDLGPVKRCEPANLFLADAGSAAGLAEIRSELAGNISRHQSTSSCAK